MQVPITLLANVASGSILHFFLGSKIKFNIRWKETAATYEQLAGNYESGDSEGVGLEIKKSKNQ